jgi:hypothetical protein
VGLRTRPEQRGSGLELLVSVELSVKLLSNDDMLGVLDSSESWVSD